MIDRGSGVSGGGGVQRAEWNSEQRNATVVTDRRVHHRSPHVPHAGCQSWRLHALSKFKYVTQGIHDLDMDSVC